MKSVAVNKCICKTYVGSSD